MIPRRVVFDTSTLVSAALRAGSAPREALEVALATCEICTSPETVEELRRVIARKRFERYLSAERRLEFAAMIAANTRLFAVPAWGVLGLGTGSRDPADNKFLALAHVAEAGVIISSDQDLLTLDPWRGARVVGPGGFLKLLVG